MKKVRAIVSCCTIAALLATTAAAATESITRTLLYQDISITVDGTEIIPTDVNGEVVEPFVMDGTTYLPLRAVSEALGYDVEWDAENNRVVISTESNSIREVVQTDKGAIRGISETGTYGGVVHSYFGIPYAEAPVGDLRWRPAQEKTPWSGILDCREMEANSYQFGTNLANFANLSPLSEDCLYLNVITPAETTDEELPVMVWFHGGGLAMGTGNEATYNNTRLPEQGCVIVSVVMRLGAFGLLNNSMLDAESETGTSGNYMLSDMIAALEWVQNNIEAFGGDQNNVTIFGESGGGKKVLALVASPKAAGLFQNAIIQSGSLRETSSEILKASGDKLFETLGVTSLEEARALPAEEIVAACNEINVSYDYCVDGVYLEQTLQEALASGEYNHVNLMIGGNKGEIQSNFIEGIVPSIVDAANNVTAYGGNAYVYLFDQTPANWVEMGGRAVHAQEMAYMWGDYDNVSRTFNGGPWELNCATWFTDADVNSFVEPELDETDRALSEIMMDMWVQFARTGNPSIAGTLWEKWSPEKENYMVLSMMNSTTPHMEAGYSSLAVE